jgi:hypothetical protein
MRHFENHFDFFFHKERFGPVIPCALCAKESVIGRCSANFISHQVVKRNAAVAIAKSSDAC